MFEERLKIISLTLGCLENTYRFFGKWYKDKSDYITMTENKVIHIHKINKCLYSNMIIHIGPNKVQINASQWPCLLCIIYTLMLYSYH